MDFNLLGIVGDAKSRHTGCLHGGLLVDHLLVEVRDDLLVRLPHLLAVLQLHHLQDVLQLVLVADLIRPVVDLFWKGRRI